jgi:hypothetical protein
VKIAPANAADAVLGALRQNNGTQFTTAAATGLESIHG